MELGIDKRSLSAFYHIANQITTHENDNFVFLEPEVIECHVKYRNVTSNGKLRLPTFLKFNI